MKSMGEAWWDAMKMLGVVDSELAQECIDDIYTAYEEPHRYYHDVRHIEHMINILVEMDLYLPILILSIIFHDVVYSTTHTTDNEKRSALYAKECLERLIPPPPPAGVPQIELYTPTVANRVHDLVLSTEAHDGGKDYAAIVLNDLDLAILGDTEDRYLQYAADIRSEYAHVPDDQYAAGRTKVLRSFLDREQIFFTHELAERFDYRARFNIQQELARYK